MTRLRTALTALLIIGLVAGGAGAAAAEDTGTTVTAQDTTTVINDHDIGDLDNSINNISTNVLGGQFDDSPVTVLF